MMRGMKEEGKVMSPMFPRLHVNDAEKGGPRAPPRNKMALYEQLSIPSQRSSSGSAPFLPPSPTDVTGLVPSTSSSHIGGRRRVMLTSFCKSPASFRGAEKLTSYSSTVVKFKDVPKDEIKSSNLVITKPLSPNYKCDENEETKVSKLKNLLLEKSRDEIFSSAQFQTPSRPHLSGVCFKDFKSEEKKKLTLTNQSASERSSSVPTNRNKPLLDPSSVPTNRNKPLLDPSSVPTNRNKPLLVPTNRRHDESSGGEIRSKFDDISNRLHGVNTARDNLDFKPEKRLRPCKDVGKSCLIPPLKDSKRNTLKNGSNPEEGNPKHSVTSTLNSASANVISPDDVVDVIGEKQFWDARKAIINQQRIFAVQVFELHRVIKVQRLIAESPNLLLEDDFSKKAVPKVCAGKKLPTEHALEPSPLSSMNKFHSRNPISLPSCKNDASKGLVIKQPVNDLPSKNIPQASTATSAKPEPWCFNPLPASQWLVPVMSPSEGLIYKPVAGLCPPNAGFISPNYGIHMPTNMNSGNADFFDAAYGVPADKQGFGVPSRTPPYFPPYSLPVIQQSLCCSAVDQSPCPKTRSNEQDNQASVDEINNYTVRHQNSYNMSRQTSRVMASQSQKVRGLKGSELQGSTATSPLDRGYGDVLPLFPMAPTMEESDQNTGTSENRSRVIKVVPHNPRTATESAAKIFQLIQEERKEM